MNSQDKVIIIGWINVNKPADCGETMKNQLLIRKLEEFGIKCYKADFKNWRKHPRVILQLLWYLISKRDSTLIYATSAGNVYPMMKLMKLVKAKRHTVHWVIGGSLAEKVKIGVFSSDVIGYVDCTIVESTVMKEQLEECGVKGVIALPNFKPIDYFPDITDKLSSQGSRPFRFVFLSRIMAEKGCDYILDAALQLNVSGYTERFTVDFYGAVASDYETVFKDKLQPLPNVKYCGFLNLCSSEGYDILSQYDIMLFPTYWKGEGFAGVFIDSFVAGVPMIATDWAHNREFLKDGETAIFIPVHDVISLMNSMKGCIEGKYDIAEMSRRCQDNADNYNVDNVVTKGLLERIGVIRYNDEGNNKLDIGQSGNAQTN